MTCLYILNNPNLYQDCVNQLGSDDALLLIENAVSMANNSNSLNQNQGFVLTEDLIARGLDSGDNWQAIDYNKFVKLTLTFKKTISWL